ncbi:MAG: DUF86 domain-containing protein [Thermoplasmata archaeon]
MLRHAAVLAAIAQKGKPALQTDATLRYAAEHATELLAEAAEKVSNTYKSANSEVPWDHLRPLRRLVAHPYDLDSQPVEIDQLWRFGTKDIPRIAKRLRESLSRARAPRSGGK